MFDRERRVELAARRDPGRPARLEPALELDRRRRLLALRGPGAPDRRRPR